LKNKPNSGFEGKQMRSYIGLIHKDAASDYSVSFPDFPGCITAGTSLDEARDFAAEALALHLEGMAEDGEAVPEPTSLEAIMADVENRNCVAILVDTPKLPDKIVRVNITLPEPLLDAIDKKAESLGMTRSGFLARAAKKDIAA
jgi:predicted RNase H-like HicB family nuclease